MAKLIDIAKALEINTIEPNHLSGEAFGITHTTKNCGKGDVFVAIKGFRLDGNSFVPQAFSQGAVAIISEDPCPNDFPLPWFQVTDARTALAKAAAVIYDHPSKKLKLVAITGTNGKTTTTTIIDAIFQAAYGCSTMLTTICNRVGDEVIATERTTPEASDTQRLLHKAIEIGCKAAVMEASSQAIDLKRVNDLEFAAVVFTNLTQDHLDYHKTMENYFAAKCKLFDGTLDSSKATAIINLDDPYGKRLLDIFAGKKITYGFDPSAQVTPLEHKLSLQGIALAVKTPVGVLQLASCLVGLPHIYNIMAAVATAISLDINLSVIKKAIESLPGVAGRFDRVECDADFSIIVDYAHTDDALIKVLETARQVTSSRVICLFGCGGDKDRTKRPLMGKAAAEGSDIVIITSDNPRSEDPEQIISDAEEGLKAVGKPYFKFVDRREAIFFAISQAKAGDIVVLAGKGHENYQVLKDKTIHFDDKEVAQEALLSIKNKQVQDLPLH